MKIITTTPTHGNGRQLMNVKLSMEFIDGYALSTIDGFAQRLYQTLPALFEQTQMLDDPFVKGTRIGELIARAALSLQSCAGMKQSYWELHNTEIPAHYEITFSCEHAEIGEYAARAAFRIIRCALYRQRYTVEPDLRALAQMKEKLAEPKILSLQTQPAIAV